MASLASVSFQTAAFLASPASASLRRSNSGSGALQLSSVAPRSCPPLRLRFVGMATPTDMNDRLSQSIKEAEEVCVADNGSGECAAAWDEVEEISAEIAHKRIKQSEKKDPLEEFCKDAPEADECRVYED
ncbi:hypothetical protein L7F22_050431 [Adiantum nelumboides]|nr:hypothetical protein [Adiantum nelumboides]MCO5596370.1 hypothetical protein [Adiantum nelumboides]